MSGNLYNFYSADGTFYPSQKKNVTIENYANMNSITHFKLKKQGQFLKVIEETASYDAKKRIYNLTESVNEYSIFTYDNKFKRILTTNVSENFRKQKSIKVVDNRIEIVPTNEGSEFTAEESAGEVPNLRSGNIVLNLIDITDEVENLQNLARTAKTAETAFKTAQRPFNTAQDALTAAQATFDTAQGRFNTAQDALTAAQAAFDTAQGRFNTAQGRLTAAQAAFDTAQGPFNTAQAALTAAQAELTAAQTAVDTA